MRYVTFSLPNDRTHRLGVVDGDRILEVAEFPSLLALIEAGPDAWRNVTKPLADGSTLKRLAQRNPDDIRWRAPVPRPRKNVFCLGRNYAEHVREATGARGQEFKLPAHPVFFTKTPTTVIGPYDDIVWDRNVTQQVDWEAELGVIIGIGGKNIPRDHAMSHVFGYTVINDVTARDLQNAHLQFFKGKSLDTFCPMGPRVVEGLDPSSLAIESRLNGETRQRSTTADLIFDVPALIAFVSGVMTLEEGDVITTGTPPGVGPLAPGDVIEIEIEGIGVLRHPVVDEGD